MAQQDAVARDDVPGLLHHRPRRRHGLVFEFPSEPNTAVEAIQITGAILAAGAATTWPPAGTVAERGSTAGAWTGPVRHSETLSLADRLAGVSSP
jgi:hypothetical protein